MIRRLKSHSAQLGISRDPITKLWFWDCRVCPGFPTVGHASTHGSALVKALFHAKDSWTHQEQVADAVLDQRIGDALSQDGTR